ncbi:MAG: hypothetical protein RL033_4666 [Pseudomonadota bacterium]
MSLCHPYLRGAVERLRAASPLALALVLGSCSDPERRRAEAQAELELQPVLNLGDCSASWVPITGGNRSDSEPPAELLFAGGDLFFFHFNWGPDGTTSSELVRFDPHAPSRELATTVIVPNAYSAPMWPDDGDLVFTQNGEVRSVPMSGGTVQTRSTFGSAGLGDIRWLGVSSGNFYFARYGQPGAIWKISLTGGPVGLFANLGPDWGYQIEPPLVQSTEGLLLSGLRRIDRLDRQTTILIAEDGSIREMPYPEGSTARPFLTPTGVIHIVDPQTPEAAPSAGTAADGSAERRITSLGLGGSPTVRAAQPSASTAGQGGRDGQGGGASDEPAAPVSHPDLRMWLSRLRGGEMTEFWPERPAAALPAHVESDGREGWFVTATEPFNDGYRHDTLWHIRPNAEPRRLACNPSPESFQVQIESRTGNAFAFGDGFVYLVSLRGESRFWELVQMSYLMPEETR